MSVFGLWWQTAHAIVPVVHDDPDPSAVVAEVSRRSGLPVEELEAVKVDELLQSAPAALGDAAIRRCARLPGAAAGSATAATMIEVSAEISRGEAAWATARDVYAAIDHLDVAVATMGCLGELVDRRLAATAFALRAGVQAQLGEFAIARSEISTALALDPEMGWEPRWPAAGRTLLDEAQQNDARVRVDLAPDASTIGPWLDAQPVRDGLMVRPGLHLLQYSTGTGIGSAWVTLGSDATIVAPASYRRPVLERIADTAGRPEVEALLRATLPDFSAAYVSVRGGVWLVAADAHGVSTTEVAAPTAIGSPEGKGKKKRH